MRSREDDQTLIRYVLWAGLNDWALPSSDCRWAMHYRLVLDGAAHHDDLRRARRRQRRVPKGQTRSSRLGLAKP